MSLKSRHTNFDSFLAFLYNQDSDGTEYKEVFFYCIVFFEWRVFDWDQEQKLKLKVFYKSEFE